MDISGLLINELNDSIENCRMDESYDGNINTFDGLIIEIGKFWENDEIYYLTINYDKGKTY